MLGLNGPGNEVDCSCPSVTEIRMSGAVLLRTVFLQTALRFAIFVFVTAILLGCYAIAIVALKFVACCTVVINNSISYTTPVLEFFSVKI